KDIAMEEPSIDGIYNVGTLARIKNVLRLPNGTIRIHVEGLKRAEISSFYEQDDMIVVDANLIEEIEATTLELEGLARNLISMFEQYSKVSKKTSAEIVTTIKE